MKKQIYVTFYKNQDIVCRGKLIYLGLLGMQVDIDPLLFVKFSNFNAVIHLDTDNGHYSCQLEAVVTARSTNYVGFTFVLTNKRILQRLKLLLWVMHALLTETDYPNKDAKLAMAAMNIEQFDNREMMSVSNKIDAPNIRRFNKQKLSLVRNQVRQLKQKEQAVVVRLR